MQQKMQKSLKEWPLICMVSIGMSAHKNNLHSLSLEALESSYKIDESLFRHKPKANFIIVSKSYRIIISALDRTTEEELPHMKCGYLD